MTKQFIFSLLLATSLSTTAQAVDMPAPGSDKGTVEPSLPASKEDDKLIENPAAAKEMAKKEDWDSLTKEQKLKRIEEKRTERNKKSDAKWKKMTADEKIAQYEKRRKRGLDMKAKRGAKKAAKTEVAPAATPAQ